MNKELSLLEKLNAIKDAVIERDCKIPYEKENEDFFLDIKTALKDSEWYKQEMIKFEKAFTEENEAKLKLKEVIGIIKEKKPNLTVIFGIYEIETYEEYLNFVKENDNEIGEDRHDLGKLLTKEEFDLLKEVLK